MTWHQLNRRLALWRDMPAPDGSGGQTRHLTEVGHVYAQVNQPTARERSTASKDGAEQTVPIHLAPGADVRRGDELRGPRGGVDEVYRVTATVTPSRDGVYLRADCELIQPERPD